MKFFSFYTFFLFITVLLHNPNAAISQEAEYERGMPFITSYVASDYSGESQNWSFIQDSDGIIYIANTIGFIEYDGVSWRQIKPENDGLPISLAKDDHGQIYAGGTGFIGQLIADSLGQMVFESLSSYLPPDFYLDFIFTTTNFKGNIYFQNQQNIISWNGSRMKIMEFPDIIELLINSSNHLYVDTKSGLYEIIDDKIELVSWGKGLSDLRVRSINELSDDTILIGTYSNGMYLIENGKLMELEGALSDFFMENSLFSSIVLPDGKLAFGTKRAGVIILNDDLSVFYRIVKSGGLSDNDIKDFYLDYDNRLWIATDNGFSVLQYPIEFTYFGSDLGLGGTIEEITPFKKELITGTFLGSAKLRALKNDEIFSDQPYAEFLRIAGTDINNMALLEYKNKLLIGTSVGTKIYDGKTVQSFDNVDSRKFFKSLINNNVVYQGHRYGCDILIFENEELINRIPVKDLTDQVRGITEDIDGSVWLCTMTNGVYRLTIDETYQTSSLEYFTDKDGLPSMRDNLVYKVEDKVVFTTHKGLFTFDESAKQFVPDVTFGDIYSDYSRFIYAFYFDENKDAWINSFRRKESALASLNPTGTYDLDIATFTPLNNMLIYEIYKDLNGIAWFGGSDGLARYEPAKFSNSVSPFEAKIRKVMVNSDSLLFGGHRNQKFIKPILNADDNEVRFENAAIFYDEGNEYQYLLEGYEDAWSSWSKESFKIYTNLSFGDYVFQVRARNIKGSLSSIDKFNFKILAPWYLTWWFLSISFTIATLIMIYIIRYFATRKLIRRVEELELIQKAQKQRERISRDLHDNVGSNLTYIISSLDYLTYKSDENKEVSDKANNLSDFTRDTLHQLRDTIWHISSETVTVKKFAKRIEGMCLRLAEISEETGWEIKVEGSDKIILQPLPALNLFRVVQEAVNNAYKYANASLISINILTNDNRIKLIVSDDGIGFEEGIEGDDGHYGLLNIKNRMNDIGADLVIESSLGNGTSISVNLKI